MRLLDRYLGGALLGTIGLTLAVLLGLFLLFEFVEQLKSLGESDYGVAEMALYVASRIPRLCYDLLPLALLIGALLGLGLLGRSGELAAMRCAGMSRAAITAAALKAGSVGIVIALALGEFVAPWAENYANDVRRSALGPEATGFGQPIPEVVANRAPTIGSAPAGEAGSTADDEHSGEPSFTGTPTRQPAPLLHSALWLRDGTSFVRIGQLFADDSIGDLLIHDYDQARRLRTATHAASARFDGSRWRLRDIRRTLFDQGRIVSTEVLDTGVWDAQLRPDLLQVVLRPPERQSVIALASYIAYLRANGLDAERYRYAIWSKLIYPLTTAMMVLLAVPLALRRGSRPGNPGRYLLLGALAGIVFHLGNRVCVNFAIVASVPPPLGTSGPVLLVGIVALLLLRRTG
ncbi:MAG: LptF/LptG family permease [Gammaproteobacteria bacterium]|nr:LptF/LptG family permease [Gammaproteobacteria bacterium]